MYLVHKCSAEFFEWGNLNADQLAQVVSNCEAAIKDLNKLDNNIADMYAAKCSKPKADLLDLMREGGWLSAKEAREWGFVDEVTDFQEPKPVLTDAVASAMAAAGIPIPNVPAADKETAFARFLASIASLFKSRNEDTIPNIDNQKQVTIMNRSFALLGKVLNTEGFAMGEDGVTLTAEQMQAIENALAERDRLNTELTRQVEALKAAPADTSKAVVDAPQQQAPASPFEDFANTVNSAKELYNLVP